MAGASDGRNCRINAAFRFPPGTPHSCGVPGGAITLARESGPSYTCAVPEPKPEPPAGRAGPPHNPGLQRLIEGKRKWHRPERRLPLPPEGGVPSLPREQGVPGLLPAEAGVRAPAKALTWRGGSPRQAEVSPACDRRKLRRGDTGWRATGGELPVRNKVSS